MPRHDFRCRKCGAVVELERSVHDESGPLCCAESCGGIEMERLISATTFHLRGPGWAADGYSKGNS